MVVPIVAPRRLAKNSARSESRPKKKSGIEWTDLIWRTIAGCTPVSPTCTHCWVPKSMARFEGRALKNGQIDSPFIGTYDHDTKHFSGVVNVIPGSLDVPFSWVPSLPRAVFVNSEADTFHYQVPDDWIRRMWDIMAMDQLSNYWWQNLTKRSERLKQLGPSLSWPDNVWAGVTVETENYLSRVDDLRECGAKNLWLSVEAMLGPMSKLDLTGIGWVVVGGESNNGGDPDRRMKEEWVIELRDMCREQDVPFYFKQWGNDRYNPQIMAGKTDPTASGPNKAKGGCLLQGKIVREIPEQHAHLFKQTT